MTITNARKHFGLRDGEVVYADGVRKILDYAKDRVRRSASLLDVEEAKRDIEACRVLLAEAI